MSKLTGLTWREASWNKRTDTPLILMKRPSSKPSLRKNGSSNTQTTTCQTASTNWTGQSRLFCSGWELDTTDLSPTCSTNSRLASLRCAHATQTSWLQNIYCSIVHYMMLWGRTHGRNPHFWGQALWQPRGAEEDSRLHEGNRHVHLAYDDEEEEVVVPKVNTVTGFVAKLFNIFCISCFRVLVVIFVSHACVVSESRRKSARQPQCEPRWQWRHQEVLPPQHGGRSLVQHPSAACWLLEETVIQQTTALSLSLVQINFDWSVFEKHSCMLWYKNSEQLALAHLLSFITQLSCLHSWHCQSVKKSLCPSTPIPWVAVYSYFVPVFAWTENRTSAVIWNYFTRQLAVLLTVA